MTTTQAECLIGIKVINSSLLHKRLRNAMVRAKEEQKTREEQIEHLLGGVIGLLAMVDPSMMEIDELTQFLGR